MNLQHVNVALAYEGDTTPDLSKAVELFHPWVSQQSLPGLLIDIADYTHVPNGPGVVLVGLEGEWYLNDSGLRYGRKSVLEGSNADKLEQAFSAAVQAAARVETEFEEVRFSRTQFSILINDRAIAPNTPETFQAIKGDVESFVTDKLGVSGVTLEHLADPRKLFAISITCESPAALDALAAS